MSTLTVEEHNARLSEIRSQLIALQPIRQELLHQLRVCELKIEGLCKEKEKLERSRIKIKICRAGESGLKNTIAHAKPIDTVKAIKGLDATQTAELLAQLLKMQKEMQHEEEETAHIEAAEEEGYVYEDYDPADEEIVEEDLTWLLDPDDEEVENTNEGE
jgi:hypothetical protein